MTVTTTSFWHPFANMAKLSVDGAVNIVRGEASTVYDDDGNAYLDGLGSLWYCNIGHGRAEIADAAAAQIRTLAAYQTFDRYTSPPVEALASRVAALAPFADAKIFFTTGGSESIDTAGKLVRSYWNLMGSPEKQYIISREHAYHGMNAYGTSLSGIPGNLRDFHPLVPTVGRVPWDDAEALRTEIARIGAENVAAFFCEPVIGAGGVIAPPDGYLPAVAAICREHDVLFVADEVVSAYGRLGRWFASDYYAIEPDIITTAKGLTSGYAPLGAVIVGPRVSEPFWSAGSAASFVHGYTYSGHTASCAIALANLDIIEREQLLDRVTTLVPVLEAAMLPLASHPLVGEVRAGTGLLAAVEIDSAAMAADPGLIARIVNEVRALGVLTRAARGVALQVSPPFVITEAEIARIGEAFAAGLDAAAR
ncbi:MAG: aminotransferase class III-fold pyridoxal phosphate-dependent enzyme [Solirubrobacterales bacterium]|nr:aminotransferase class III-fold pyridoxal phosphate-dependent enzyme [Solirubrobacterales bacterium]